MDPRRSSRAMALAAAFALTVVTVACGSTSPTPPPSGSSAPSSGSPSTAGGRLTVGLSAETESLDPALVYQSAGLSVMYALFDTLLTVRADGTLGPGLADSWRLVDPKTLELKLHPGVTFHNGEAVDARAVAFSLYRLLDRDPESGEPITDDAEKLNSQWGRDYSSVNVVEVVDPNTVIIRLRRPDAALPNALGRLFVVPPGYWLQAGKAGFAQKPVGSGPFTFVEWLKDDHVTLRKNASYWDSPRGRPLVDEVVFRPIPDPATRLNELVSGGVQLIQDPPPDELDAIEAAGGRVPTIADARRYMVFLTADGKGAVAEDPNASTAQKTAIEALGKRDVRVALNLAVDRQAIIDTLLGGRGEKMSQVFVPGDLGFDPSLRAFEYDPDRARQLLAGAGYPDGFEADLDICTCDRTDLPEAVAAQLEQVGVNVTIHPFEITQFNSDWGAGRTNPMRAARLSFSDVNVYLQLWLRSGGLLSRYGNPDVDGLIDQQAAEYDVDKRAALLRSIARLTRDDAPALFLWSSPNLYGVAASVPDWQPHLLGYLPVVGVAVTH